ncbi:hypothetical protein RF55_25619 [Lasius niger]|uniref:Uncharacterized protein n=1 Tax=Lasius niger TaxID=67767 RepID=A0A0J7JTP8_LASNI|nr:hypothetical protein RF55_25619 [Lasius niger]
MTTTQKTKVSPALDGRAELREVLLASGDTSRLRNIKLHLGKSDATVDELAAYTAGIIKAAKAGRLPSSSSFKKDFNEDAMDAFLKTINS